MKSLCKVTEMYHVSTAAEADVMIKEAQEDSMFTLIKATKELKNIKEKKEIVDTYYVVTLVKEFTDIKEPTEYVRVLYEFDED